MARPTKRRRTSGSITYLKAWKLWQARYFVGDKRKAVYGKTKAEAEEKLNRMLVMIADGSDVSEDPKFSEYAEMWLEMKESMGSNLKERTLNSYRHNLKTISEFIGERRLSKIKASHLEFAYIELLKRGKSNSTVNSIHRSVTNMWNTAFKKGVVRANIPAIAEAPSNQKRNPTVLSREEWKTVIEASRNMNDGLIVEFLLKTGMRITVEALATKWHQIDFDSGTVTVGESKTEAGAGRVIPLDDELLEQLKLRKQEQESKVNLDDPLKKFNPKSYVFCNSVGNIHSRENLRRYIWKQMKEVAGISERTTFHDLRHNAGSYLISEGVPITTVSKILGHANPSITLSIYAHELPEDVELVRIAMSKLAINKG